MKKLFVTISLALISLGAFAQKGEQNVGAHLLYGTDMEIFGVGVKYQNNLTDAIRLEGVFDYYPKSDGFSMFDVNVNGHYLFPITDKVTLYPLVGINYTHWKQSLFDGDDEDEWFYDDEEDVSMNDGSIGLNIGGGVQYKLTDKIRIGAELKYQTISGFNTPVVGFGVTYTL